MSDIQITADFTDLQLLSRSLVNLDKKAQDSAKVFETAFKRAETQLKKNAVASQSHYNSILGVETGYKKASVSATTFERSLAKEEAALKANKKALDDVLRSIDPLYNSTVAYESKLEVLNTELRKQDPTKYAKQLELLQKQATRSGLRLDNMGRVIGTANKSTRQMELQFQQAGYQIQDFIVQVQGGVNPLIAFSQQGSQLAGFFAGPWGAAIGLGIAALSTLGLAFMASRGETEDFEDALSDLESVVNDYTTSAELAGLSTEELAEKFGYGSEAVRGYLEAFAELRKQVAIDELTEAAAALGDEFERLISVGGTRGGTLRVNVEELREEFNLTREEALNIKSAIDQVGDSEGIDEVEASAHNLVDVLTSIYGSLGEIPPEFREMAFAAEAVTLQVLEIESVTASSTSAMEVLSGATSNLTGFASTAASAFGDLATNAWESARALAATRLAQAESVGRGRGNGNLELEAFREGSTLGDPYGFLQQMENLRYTPPTSRSSSRSSSRGSSRSSGSSRTEEDYLKTLQEEIAYKTSLIGLSEQEIARAEFIQDLKENEVNLDDRRIESLWEQQQALDAATKAEEERVAKLEKLEDHLNQFVESTFLGLDSIEDAFKDMISNILTEIYQQQVLSPIADFGSSLLGGLLGGSTGGDVTEQANGGAWLNGVQMYANGGIFDRPTMFQHSGGLGVMGEAGPEAIMPLKRGSDGKLGVATDGSTSGSQQVHVTYQIVGNGDEYIMEQISKSAPQIVKAAESSILQSRKRGGKFKSTFK